MTRKHFLESMEREIDFQREYEKLEDLCNNYQRMVLSNPINPWIEQNFLYFGKRANYCSFSELREHLGFDLKNIPKDVDMNKYFLFCEMILTLCMDLRSRMEQDLNEMVDILYATIKATVGKVGFEVKLIQGEIMIVENNAIAMKVADYLPDLSKTVIEYNHFLLKGNIARKRELIKLISDALESKRPKLKRYCNKMTDDFFFLVNKMNVRHNNCDSEDKAHYCEAFDTSSLDEKEQWYDTIYDQGLALIVMLEQQDRNAKIEEFKSKL